MPDDIEVGKTYLELVNDQLTHERSIRASLEHRAMTVVTTSGALVALLLGLAGLQTRLQQFVVPGWAIILVLVAVGLLVGAALAALVANRPARQEQIGSKELRSTVEQNWAAADYVDVLRKAILVRCDLLASIRRMNRRKTQALAIGMVFETLALLVMATAVFAVLS